MPTARDSRSKNRRGRNGLLVPFLLGALTLFIPALVRFDNGKKGVTYLVLMALILFGGARLAHWFVVKCIIGALDLWIRTADFRIPPYPRS
jgi:hypothetical protein